MHSIRTLQTPVGRALYSTAAQGLTLSADVSKLSGFRLHSRSGLIVWTERLKRTCIIVHGESVAQSVLRAGELHLVLLAKGPQGEMIERYAIPAVDVMAVTPFDEAAHACRDLVVRQCESRQLH